MVLTSDGSYRGSKTIDLKGIVDDALEQCPGVKSVLVTKRTGSEINMKEGRDQWKPRHHDLANEDTHGIPNRAGQFMKEAQRFMKQAQDAYYREAQDAYERKRNEIPG